ncbi:hypothetical protein B0H17DRAFT_1193653 [Mycena rosella]|uniref:Zn(2)-C6 fungal-type domain-containing protein n=1 Tax=Mycena rosella TaxID=1033263 RepID=A0AAD7M788_MYCRO|nr:hypothetical protein B0H17DRAFT_1193653 [Mycena rosella]
MKRSREPKDDSRAAASTKKAKSIQACTSCRKHKTRCEILDPSKSPVRCHRCQVLALQCSYEETILPTASTSRLPSPPPQSVQMQAGPLKPPVKYPTLPPTDRLWSFVESNGPLDWSAPMLAVQQLSKLPLAHLHPPAHPTPPLPPGELTLARILSEERMRYLLDLFDERYTPWLNFKPTTRTGSALLDTVCCAVAARHLENAADVKMQLQTLTEDSIAKMIFNPRPSESVEAIQALLILSLWAPLGGPQEDGGRDGRLLIASAVSMAMNLRLNQAAEKATALRKKNGGRLSVEDTETLEATLENARLWISLTNTESMLCLGTGRVPLSRRSPEDLQLIEFPRSFVGLLDYGDVRLGLVASSFDLLEEGVGSRLQPGVDVDNWYDGIMVVLEKMKRIRRLLTPLPYVLEREQFYVHILHVYESMSRLLVLYHALWDARVSVGNLPPGESWHPFFKPHGVEAVGEWGRDMIQTTEALLVSVLAADTRRLGTAPDNLFTMVALAAGYVVGVKFLMARGGTELAGASDLLLARIVAHLNNVACAPGHAAQRAAFLVTGMIAKWEGRNAGTPAPASYPTPTPSADADGDFLEPLAFNTAQLQQPPDIDFNLFMDSTISMDAEFWNSLAQTQPELLAGYQ